MVRTQTFQPILLHNLCKSHGHHYLWFTEILSEENVTVVPCNSETYVSFPFFVPMGKANEEKLLNGKFNFLLSIRFLSKSLEKLVTTLEAKDYIQ